MGAVYWAFDIHLRIAVAIKENCLEDPAMRAAFKREAQLLAALRHRSLPICRDFLEVDGGQFLVMDFIEGDDLATALVKARAPLPNQTLEELAWQLLDAMQYLEEEGVRHRDIKSRNVKFVNGRVYLLDFGIAYGVSGEMETVGVGEGKVKYSSKRYSPPEQLKGEDAGPSGELYSFAATLYHAMTNVEPTDARERLESLALRRGDPLEDVRIYNRAADERMSRAVMLALSLRPEDRPQSAAALRELMFPEAYAQEKAAGVLGFLNLRLLTEVFALGVFACILLFVLRQPQTSETLPPLALDTPRGVPAPVLTHTPTPESTPTPTATPTPDRTPAPAEEVAGPSRAEQAERLSDEAARARQSGNVELALSLLKQALALNEKNPSVHYQLGDILLDKIVAGGRWAERMPEVLAKAERVLELTRSPRSGREYLARSWAEFAKAYRDPLHPDRALLGLAIADANEVLKKYDPESAAAMTIRASATYARDDSRLKEQAAGRVLEDFNRVVRLTPLDPQAHANLAEVHFDLAGRAKAPSRAEHLELARRGFEKAKGMAPRRADFLTDLGDVYFELRAFKKAGEIFRAAIKADPNYPHAYARLGAAYNRLGQPDRAAEVCAQGLKLRPDDSAVRQELRQELQRARSDRADGR